MGFTSTSKKQDGIKLHTFGAFLGAPDSSPFVIKTMMLLKMAGKTYRCIPSNPLRAPLKLLPFIVDQGEKVADSTLIRTHIENKYQIDFDAALNSEQKASAWSIERMCEDHLYFAMLELRWLDPAIFEVGVSTMFGDIPAPLRSPAKALLRRMNAKRLRGHGLGRHPRAEIVQLGIRDINALAVLLGEKSYLMGETPCGADATVFGMIASILLPAFETPLRAAVNDHDILVAYSDRIMARYFNEESIAQ